MVPSNIILMILNILRNAQICRSFLYFCRSFLYQRRSFLYFLSKLCNAIGLQNGALADYQYLRPTQTATDLNSLTKPSNSFLHFYGCSNAPTDYGTGFDISQNSDNSGWGIQFDSSMTGNNIYYRWTTDHKEWNAWQELAKKSDLANYENLFERNALGSFSNLIPNNADTYLIVGNRLSISDSFILLVSNYQGSMKTLFLYNSGSFATTVDTNGSVTVTWNGSNINVSSVAIKIR